MLFIMRNAAGTNSSHGNEIITGVLAVIWFFISMVIIAVLVGVYIICSRRRLRKRDER